MIQKNKKKNDDKNNKHFQKNESVCLFKKKNSIRQLFYKQKINLPANTHLLKKKIKNTF